MPIHNYFVRGAIVFGALILAACGGESESDAAADADKPQAAAPAQPAATPPKPKEIVMDPTCDAPLAKRTFVQCKVCHSVQEGERNLTGPNLFGVVGRKAASVEKFAYSPVLRKSGIVWNDETLDGFLENPPKYLPGNRMAFGGVRNPEARAAVICYLRALK